VKLANRIVLCIASVALVEPVFAAVQNCENIKTQSLLRSKLLDQPQFFLRNDLRSLGPESFRGTQRTTEAGVSVDLAELWDRSYETNADDLECKSQLLLEALRQNGPDLLIRAEIAGLKAKLDWNTSEETRINQEMETIEKRLRIGKESLLNKEKLAHALFQIRNRIRSLKSQIVTLDAQLLTSDVSTAPTPIKEYSQLLKQYQITRARAQIARSNAARDNWSFKVSAGISTNSGRPLALNHEEQRPFVEAQLSFPILGPALRPILHPAAEQMATMQATDVSQEGAELHRIRNIEQEVNATIRLLDEDLKSYQKRETEIQDTLKAVSVAGGESIHSSYQLLSGQLLEIQEHLIYLKSKLTALTGELAKSPSGKSASSEEKFKAVQLEATSGTFQSGAAGMVIDGSPKFRARSVEQPGSDSTTQLNSSHIVQLDFDSVQFQSKPEPLESGEIRYQLGVFFRASNQCNLVYLMLRFDSETSPPEYADLYLQEKKNPGKSSHEACLNDGYRTLKTSAASKRIRVQPAGVNQLKLQDSGSEISVWFNQEMITQITVQGLERPAKSYVGVRSDNINCRFNLSEAH
jgi:hypothetical protein